MVAYGPHCFDCRHSRQHLPSQWSRATVSPGKGVAGFETIFIGESKQAKLLVPLDLYLHQAMERTLPVRVRTRKAGLQEVSTSFAGGNPRSGRRKGGRLLLKSSASRLGGGGSALSDNIATLCSQSPAITADFDGRVRGLLQEVYDQQGTSGLEDCFDMLHQWLSKKEIAQVGGALVWQEERTSINNWTAYIMKLLRNWKQSRPVCYHCL